MEATYNAGFILQYLWGLREKLKQAAGFELEKQSQKLSTFSIRTIQHEQARLPANEAARRIAAVYSNLICRGLPTFTSLLVEQTIITNVESFITIRETHHAGNIRFSHEALSRKQESDWLAALSRAYFPIDPRLSPGDYGGNVYDSDAERFFHSVFLPQKVSPALGLVIQPQRNIESMLPIQIAVDFIDQRVDFVYEGIDSRLVFEVDGSQHLDIRQQGLDQKRDRVLSAGSWQVYRIPTGQLEENLAWPGEEQLRKALNNEPDLALLEQAYQTPPWVSENGRAALQTVLMPYGIARIQRALLLALQSGSLSFDSPTWKIVVLERDLRCASLAVLDFIQHLYTFNVLMGIEQPLPDVELLTFYTPEFETFAPDLPQHALDQDRIRLREKPIAEYERATTAGDVIVDLSMLAYQGYCLPNEEFYDQHLKSDGVVYIIRNAYHFQETRQLQSLEPFPYDTENPDSERAMVFFLQNIFRKQRFRDGQKEILQRSLAHLPVIGLLPTGAGKSLCYQLSALLQPGLTVVVDPLISLMIDQLDNLKESYAIDWVGYINSNQTGPEREKMVQRMAGAQLLFIFVSPERFQNKDFRTRLEELTLSHAIAYAVIDEAHCVSEWGHDFRTSYLKLADTIRRFCKYQGDFTPTVIALTGTASYAVLSDVQREIGVDDEQAKVYPQSFDRKELTFDVKLVDSRNKGQYLRGILRGLHNQFNIPQEAFFQPNGEQTYAGIVFVPHVNGQYGVYDVHIELAQELRVPVKYFSGDVPKSKITNQDGSSYKAPVMTENEFQSFKVGVQRAFKSNEFSLLVATKAFGMGIDKPNIRYTIHYNIPQSLEAYYQEAGRAGRDERESHCILIFSDDMMEQAERALATDAPESVLEEVAKTWGGGDIHRLLFLHRNSFKGRKEEYNRVLELLQRFIYPRLTTLATNKTITFIIPFGYDTERMAREKALYRLSIIGLVQDYTVDFNAKAFEVSIARKDDAEYVSRLQTYIQRYRTREVSEFVPDQVAQKAGNIVIEKCLVYLLDFVYEEIEKKRRAAIRSMAEVARKASMQTTPEQKDKFIRQELLAYLEHSPFTQPLLNAARQIVPEDWHRILQMRDDARKLVLHSVDGARQLLGGCRRTLESYADHPGVLFLSGLARLLLPDPDLPAALGEFRGALRNLAGLSDDLRERALQIILADYHEWLKDTRDYPRVRLELAEAVLEIFPSRQAARQYMDVLPAHCEQVLANLALQEVVSFRKRLFVKPTG